VIVLRREALRKREGCVVEVGVSAKQLFSQADEIEPYCRAVRLDKLIRCVTSMTEVTILVIELPAGVVTKILPVIIVKVFTVIPLIVR
jgi:hypothetical protein